MSPQTKNRLARLHERLKPYYSVIAIVVSTLSLSWQISHSVAPVIYNDIKELHANTSWIEQHKKDFSELKSDVQTGFKQVTAANDIQDEKISQNKVDIAFLKGKN